MNEGRTNFITFSAHIYLQLKPGTDPKALEAKFPQMVDTHAAAQIEQDLGKSWQDYKRAGNGYRYFRSRFAFIHLDPTNIEAKISPGGNINYIYFLISVRAAYTRHCLYQLHEPGYGALCRTVARGGPAQKAMRSLKGQLISQFPIESIVLSLFYSAGARSLHNLCCRSLTALPIKIFRSITRLFSSRVLRALR